VWCQKLQLALQAEKQKRVPSWSLRQQTGPKVRRMQLLQSPLRQVQETLVIQTKPSQPDVVKIPIVPRVVARTLKMNLSHPGGK
jgi:hypothetical protein